MGATATSPLSSLHAYPFQPLSQPLADPPSFLLLSAFPLPLTLPLSVLPPSTPRCVLSHFARPFLLSSLPLPSAWLGVPLSPSAADPPSNSSSRLLLRSLSGMPSPSPPTSPELRRTPPADLRLPPPSASLCPTPSQPLELSRQGCGRGSHKHPCTYTPQTSQPTPRDPPPARPVVSWTTPLLPV